MSEQDLKQKADEEFSLNFENNKNKNKWKDAIFLLDDTRESRLAYRRFKHPAFHQVYMRRLKGEDI